MNEKKITLGTKIIHYGKIAVIVKIESIYCTMKFDDNTEIKTLISVINQKNILDEFEITVWFRYVIAGEQEKEYDIHKIAAVDVQDAVNKAKLLYPSRARIPFAYYHNKIKYQPQN